MEKYDLANLLQKEEVIANADLHKDLKVLLEANKHYNHMYNYPTSLSINTYQYLFENNHLTAKNIFTDIFFQDQEKHDFLIDLALSHKIDFSSIYSMPLSASITDLEKFIDNGLTLNNAAKLILANNNPNNHELQIKLMETLVDKGASLVEVNHIPNYFSKETYGYMLEHGLKAISLLRTISDIEDIKKADELLELALANISNLNEAVKEILYINHHHTNERAIASQIKLTETLVNKGASLVEVNHIPNYFSKETYGYMLEHGLKDTELLRIITDIEAGEKHNQLMELALSYKEYAPNFVLKYAAENGNVDMLKLALSHGADVNTKLPNEEFGLLVNAFMRHNNTEIIDLLIKNGISLNLTTLEYVAIVKQSSIDCVAKVISQIPNIPSDNELYEIFRSHGESESESSNFIDYSSLINEYILSQYGLPTSLSKIEIEIINGNTSASDIEDYRGAEFTNKYGYTPLHLALISKNYNLAAQMVKNGFDLYAQSNSGVTPLHLLPEDAEEGSDNLMKETSERIDDVDMDLGSGETLVNYLLTNNELANKTIALSKDPLTSLLKQDVDLFTPSSDLTKTNIAISDGEGFWSTSLWSVAREISKNFLDVNFYLVRENMLKDGGKAFFSQFDAVINPGAGDNFPAENEFTKEDCLSPTPLEMHYQTMLEYSDNLNIPYLGMCAGAQHLSLYHDGSLKKIDGYSQGHHQVNYIKGTLPYFMSLTKEQQSNALKNCELPEVSFKGDTAHHYAAVEGKLGNDLQLGAISEDNVVMSFASNNGIRYSTQFHPEHHYGNQDNNAIHQNAWLNNFVEIARMHHAHRVNGDAHPTEYYTEVKARLDECIFEPTCLVETYAGLILDNTEII
jgi:anthranilate/para-aminobenzoate synthase component II